IALTQTPDRPRRGGRGGGGGGMGRGAGGGGGGPRRFDPNMAFNWMAKGKDVLVIAEVQPSPRDPAARERMEEFAKRNGISNGQLTREQFARYMEEQMAERMSRRGGPPGQGGGPPGQGGGRPRRGGPPPAAGVPDAAPPGTPGVAPAPT